MSDIDEEAPERVNAFLDDYIAECIEKYPTGFVSTLIQKVFLENEDENEDILNEYDLSRTKEEWLKIVESGIEKLGLGTEKKTFLIDTRESEAIARLNELKEKSLNIRKNASMMSGRPIEECS